MKDLLQLADEIPVTLVVALAYVTMAVLTDVVDPTVSQLVAYGAARGVEVGDGEAWRLLTHAFLHGGWWHLLVNTYALLILGPTLERSIGSVRFAVVYLVAAVGGGVAGTLWHEPLAPLVGGSGALFGMMGSMVALMSRGGRDPIEFVRSPAGRQLLGMIAINLAIGFVIPFISNAAHIGGLLCGFAVTFFFLTHARRPMPGANAARAGAALVFCGWLALAIWPVHRWDHLLLQWERTAPGPRRDELRQAFGLGHFGDERAVDSDEQMQQLAEQLRELRRLD